MRDKIKALESIALELEPEAPQREQWWRQLNAYTENFQEQLPHTKAYNLTQDKGKALLDHPISEQPTNMKDLLALFRDNVDFPGLNPASQGHLAYIPGGGIYPSALGDYLAAVTNRYAGVFFASPGAVRLENQLINWMKEVIGYPSTAGGNLTTGGSLANLIGIVAARDAMNIKAKDFDRSVIYLSAQAHHSVSKSIRIAGLRECILRIVPVDDRYRMDANALEELVKADQAQGLLPFMVIASAGTTDTGAIDPMDAIADIASANNIWFHVDAAYGGFFILCDEIKPHYKGIERSDSLSIDPHKGLFLPYGLGTVLVRNEEHLQESNSYHAHYMQDTVHDVEEPSPAHLSPELSKHFRGLRMWLPLQLFGVKPFRAGLEEKLYLCRYFHQEIQQTPGFEVGPEPDLSVMVFRHVPVQGDANEFNRKLTDAIQQDGRVFLSSTTIDGVFWLRLAVLSFRTHLSTIDLCLQVVREYTDQLNSRQS